MTDRSRSGRCSRTRWDPMPTSRPVCSTRSSTRTAVSAALRAMNGPAPGLLRDVRIDGTSKGMPRVPDPVPLLEAGTQGWTLDDLEPPFVVIRRSALEHNVSLMAAYCDEHGVSIAPHGKTTMAPQLWRRQLDAGAWGISATAAQARVMRGRRPRILVANPLTDAAIRWAAHDLRDDANELACYVDSERGSSCSRLSCGRSRPASPAGAARARPRRRSHRVPGCRGGSRRRPTRRVPRTCCSRVSRATRDDRRRSPRARGGPAVPRRRCAWDAARGARSPVLGVVGERRRQRLLRSRGRRARRGSIGGRDAGGAACGGVRRARRRDVRALVAVRAPSGRGPVPQRDRGVGGRALHAEDGLAIVGLGRRDVSFDQGLPRVLAARRGGGVDQLDGAVEATALDDQHLYCRVRADTRLRAGDLVACGISHPCSMLDRWRFLPWWTTMTPWSRSWPRSSEPPAARRSQPTRGRSATASISTRSPSASRAPTVERAGYGAANRCS